VTSFDNSDEQLAKDRLVADRDSLELETVRGDMADLSCFADESFDLIFHPCSNLFAPEVQPVWRECFRVLKAGGRLLVGITSPMYFLFDHDAAEKSGQLVVQYTLPYSDLTSLPPERRRRMEAAEESFIFGHTLEQQLGGQLAAGFVLTGLYEDNWDDQATPLNRFGPLYIATLARKP
jgi:ubiquinone/menaquinone biosynthesis C-methylase UbiE